MNRMLLAPFTLAVLALAVAVAPRAASQDLVPDSPLEGSWWVETRSPYVIGNLTFAKTAVAGAFDVTGALMVRMPRGVAETEDCRPVELFTVTTKTETKPDATIALGPTGQLKGELTLTGPTCTGTLKIVRGKDGVVFGRDTKGNVDKSETVPRVTLRGRLMIGTRDLRRVVSLRGVKLPSANLRRWLGESSNARVRGTRITSNKFGILLTEDALGFPFLRLRASGAVSLERERRDGVVLSGTIAVSRYTRGLVRIDATGELKDDLGGGVGRSQHRYSGNRFEAPTASPVFKVHTRMAAASGPFRRVVLEGQLE